MAVIFLHGYLGRKYGQRFELAVHSAAEAIRLLDANFRGFMNDVVRYRPGFVVRVDGQAAVDVKNLRKTHIAPEIHIVPAIAGAGGNNNGWGQVAMAVVIAVAAYYGGPQNAGWFSSATQGAMYSAALSMGIGGVSQLLFASQQQKTDDMVTGEENKASYAFNGPVNTTKQGNPVPVLYGRLRVGSQVISAGLSSDDV